jgi:hypothetical protein
VDYLIDTVQFAPDDDDREDAAEDLAVVGDARALPVLERVAAYDPDSSVRKEAHRALLAITARQPVVVTAPTVAAASANQQVEVQQTVTPATAQVVAPAQVTVVPAPVYVTPAPVFVSRVVYPAPVVVSPVVPYYTAPRFGTFFSFGFSGHGHSYGHSRYHHPGRYHR